ncbi:maleylpyruvate isomerase family mycothiol-dependent enzyme [Microtetraspora sp. AC03309]|uniref:maleylpyruvate isomerase family mycothiol-dependent enzyme n=1 Tax=Microtetraspora sp. AC03309 TaxID=2779376 RepID=UPI001E4C3D59|nr:maleylpyruvate isomerase family mycothiol-dependent enzyme [Microtetraspora sp. AC03309]MCC5579952.1 maleylpyruvate isomerase family mycothiol-dependent enzyme [Microtetraspora sp. AC03309]
MELTPARTIDGLIAEYAAFADLVGGLSLEELDLPTRCANWAVRDVAAHVVGNAADTLALTVGSRSPDEQARAFRDHDHAAELRSAAADIRPLLHASTDYWNRPSLVPERTIGNGVLTLWYDAYLHADDIRTALGRPSERGPGLAAAVRWVVAELGAKGWGPARIALDGSDETGVVEPGGVESGAFESGAFEPGVFEAGVFEIGGAGAAEEPILRADALRFVLVATGRADPAELGLDESVNVHH